MSILTEKLVKETLSQFQTFNMEIFIISSTQKLLIFTHQNYTIHS